MATNRKVERWGLDRLRPHPKQGQYFPDAPAHEVAELAADLEANGQLQPVEALPDGTLIAGHKRLAATRLLGRTEIDVWVRPEFAGDPAAGERRLIEDNLHRRQLGPLGLARCYKALRSLESKGLDGRLFAHEARDLRDRLGQRLRVSGRSLDRYLRVLEHTPAEVQAAFEAGTLPLNVAEQVANLNAQQQRQLAAELRAGGSPREVVRRHLGAAPPRPKTPGHATDRLVQALKLALADLDGQAQEVHNITPGDEEALRGGERLLRLLLKQARALRKAEAAEGDLPPAGEIDPEADEAGGGPADAARPAKLAGSTDRRPINGEKQTYSAASGAGEPDGGPGQAAGRRTARRPGRSRPAGAKKGRAKP
jgi:ParB-like chromosome segregation protein Spo0J